MCTIALTPRLSFSLAAYQQVPIAMSKRLLVVVLLPCFAVFTHTAVAQTPLSGRAPHSGDAAKHPDHNAQTYPQFAYPSVSPGSNATPARTPRHRATHPPAAAINDPYAFGGWNNLSYDAPSLDHPWSANAPADRVPQPGQ
jgi:hypothetical protein